MLARRLTPASWAVAGLAALLLWLYPEVVLRGRVFFERDIGVMSVPMAEDFVRTLRLGSWPAWDPWRGFGRPAWANSSVIQVLYPLTWLHTILDPWTVYAVAVLVHLLGAGTCLLYTSDAADE